jgi:RNA polymerase sigma factor (sigma-70 family)
MQRQVDYVDSEEFLDENSIRQILSESLDKLLKTDSEGKSVLLNRQQERILFRRYNCLKYLYVAKRTRVNMTRPGSGFMNELENHLQEAERIKQFIIESNMPLVISIVSKHLATGAVMADLISEGNLLLMKAVEKFDYIRGYRFSTFAAWVINTGFARKIPAEAGRPDRPGSTDVADLQLDMRLGGLVDIESVERAHYSLEEVIRNNLTEREQYIVRHHFALDGNIRSKPKSLRQIGEELGLTAERIRQIELKALQKLRHSLSQEEFDLLTG